MLGRVLAGLAAGAVSGMGIGGGTVLIPILVILMGMTQQVAQSVNLWYFIPTGAVALFTHIKQKNVDLKCAAIIAGAGVASALLGSWLALKISPELLKRFFGIFLLIAGLYEIFFSKAEGDD